MNFDILKNKIDAINYSLPNIEDKDEANKLLKDRFDYIKELFKLSRELEDNIPVINYLLDLKRHTQNLIETLELKSEQINYSLSKL